MRKKVKLVSVTFVLLAYKHSHKADLGKRLKTLKEPIM